MSSPNHPTSDIVDSFSSKSLDYIPASPDYFLTSPGNTSSNSSVNPSGLILIASPTPSLFHDDPYMKVMYAYYAKESPIPTPMTSSTVLSPSSTIEEILNYLEELSFYRIEKMEERLVNGWMVIQRDFYELKTELEKIRSQISELQKKNLGQKDKIAFARFKISILKQPLRISKLVTSSEGAVGLIRWFKGTESVFSCSNFTEDCKVNFATGTLTEEALSWWNSFAQPIRIEKAYKITWVKFKKLLIKKYYTWTEFQKKEDEFYHLTVKGNDLKIYVRRFQEFTTLCPTMVSDSKKLLEAFIVGLPRCVEGNVTASKLKL
nr:reverse transcriptase domain-containing protein [Tanacetum cinerariifolium]